MWFEENIRRVVGDGREILFWHDTWVGDISFKLKFSRLFDLSMYKESTVDEMARLGWNVGGRAWEWRRRLLAWEEESVGECSVMLLNVVLHDIVHDTWRWLLDHIHGYSVRGAYHFLTTSGSTVDRHLVDDVWHKLIPSKVSVFVWRLLRDRLPTKDDLARRRIIQATDTACPTACGMLETAKHLFLDCGTFGSIWSLVFHWLGISSVIGGELRHHFLQFTHMAGLPRSTHLHLRVIWFASVWVIWKERNNRVFNNVVTAPPILLEKIKLNSFLWLKSKRAHFSYSYHDWWKHPLLCMGVH